MIEPHLNLHGYATNGTSTFGSGRSAKYTRFGYDLSKTDRPFTTTTSGLTTSNKASNLKTISFSSQLSASTWRLPSNADVSKPVVFEAIGAGGYGANGDPGNLGAGGGGGGAYAKITISNASLNDVFAITVPISVIATAQDAVVTRNSQAFLLAKGGASASTITGGAGGASASCVGDVAYSGGNASNTVGLLGGTGGASANATGNGANASGGTAGVATGIGGNGGSRDTAGSSPGGGAGGSSDSGTAKAGGTGLVTITYYEF